MWVLRVLGVADSAALAHDLGLPDPREALVHVTRPKVHGDRVRAGLSVLDIARTAIDMAREHGLTDGTRTVWCDMRVGRHVFEVDGRQKYVEGNLTGMSPDLAPYIVRRR